MNAHIYKVSRYLLLGICACFLVTGCDFEYELPEAGSIADETPPKADFSFSADPEDYTLISFSNTSSSATDYSWDFGNGETSTDKNPSSTFPDGTYTVTLTATDKLGASNTVTKEITIEQPAKFIPNILEAGFEDGTLDGEGDGRDSWRNDAGGVIQITESPVFDGTQAAKLPAEGDRVGMQLIPIEPNQDYILSFYYTIKSDPGTLTVAILSDMVTDLADVEGATIASVALTDNSDANTYVETTLEFNSGDNSNVAIFFHNEGSECRLDNFDIE